MRVKGTRDVRYLSTDYLSSANSYPQISNRETIEYPCSNASSDLEVGSTPNAKTSSWPQGNLPRGKRACCIQGFRVIILPYSIGGSTCVLRYRFGAAEASL